MNRLNRFLLLFAVIIGLIFISDQVIARDLSLSDERFLNNAAEAGHFEVAASQLALKKSKNSEILNFAKMMTDDHANAALKLKDLATRRRVELNKQPSLIQQGKLKYLETRDGVKFDQSYASMIGVTAHEHAVKIFEDASEDANDPDIRKFAMDTLPVLRKHLDEAKKIDAKVNKDD